MQTEFKPADTNKEKSFRCRRFTSILLLFLVIFATIVLPARYGETSDAVWIEGDSATSHDFNQHGWYSSSGLRLDLLSPGVPEQSDGQWLVHYTGETESTAIAEYTVQIETAGTYTWWARLSADRTAYSYRVGEDSWTEIFVGTSAQHARDGVAVRVAHERVNLVANSIDIRAVGWVNLGEHQLDAGTHRLQVRVRHNPQLNQTHGGIDAMVLVSSGWSPSGAVKPDSSGEPAQPGDWFPLVNAANDPFSPESLIDMTAVVQAHSGVPAGVHGHLKQVDSRLEFSGRPGTPVKLWGTNSSPPADAEAFESQARFYVKHGINLVRRHYILAEIGEDKDSFRLDHYDKWFAALKNGGVYTDWSVFYPDSMRVTPGFLPEWDPADPVAQELKNEFESLLAAIGLELSDLWDELPESSGGRRIGGFDNFVYAYQQATWEWLRHLLLHENPYTGMRYVDDPALAIIEIQNESSIFWHWPLNNLSSNDYPRHSLLLRKMWYRWLGDRYANNAELASAWGAGLRSGDSVEEFNPSMKIYGAWEMSSTGPEGAPAEAARMGDFIRFLAETQRNYFSRRYSRLRDMGYHGVVISTAWKAGGAAAGAANLYTDDAADLISRHSYRGGGEGGHYVAPGSVNDYTHLGDAGEGILSVGLWQVEDKPFGMTEWNVNPPNQWRAEIIPLFAFYGMGLQGWDISLHFSGSGERYRMGGGWPGYGRGPSSYVTETPLYLAQFPAVAFAIYNNHIAEAEIAAGRRLSPEDIFQGIDALEQDFTGGGWDDPELVGNVATPPEVLAIGRVTSKIGDDPAPSSKVDWSNYWDEENESIESMTGELTWDYGQRIVMIHSQKTQGVIGFAGGREINLPAVTVTIDESTPYVSLLFTPLDNRPLSASGSILITALARDRQRGTQYSDDGTTLTNLGGPPLEMEPVQAVLSFSGEEIEAVEVLDFYGVPTGTTIDQDGNTFQIDGRHETYYYHVRRPSAHDPEDPEDPEDPNGSENGEDSNDTKDDSSGCGCKTSSGAGTTPLFLLLIMLFAVGKFKTRARS